MKIQDQFTGASTWQNMMYYKIESMEMEVGKLPLLMMEKDIHLPCFYRHFKNVIFYNIQKY